MTIHPDENDLVVEHPASQELLDIALKMGSREMGLSDLLQEKRYASLKPLPRRQVVDGIPVTLMEIKQAAVAEALAENNGNVSAAARQLQVNRATVMQYSGRAPRCKIVKLQAA